VPATDKAWHRRISRRWWHRFVARCASAARCTPRS